MYAIGFSAGGNLLLNQIAREPAYGTLLHAMAAINAPIDMPMTVAGLGRPRNTIYMRAFVRALVAAVRMKRSLGESYSDPDQPHVTTVPEFDRRYILPEVHLSSVEEYYSAASSAHELWRIQTPTLLVASHDDPIVSINMFQQITQRPANVHLAISDRGGHIGYFYRRRREWRFWAADASLDFFESV
jgi:hypothetical protein